MLDKIRMAALWLLAVAGLAVAVLAGLAEHFPWAASLCTGYSDACAKTARFALYGLPIWPLGAAFYLALMLCLLKARKAMPLLAALGLGAEAALGVTLYVIKAPCVFCLANLAVVLLIFLVALDFGRFWQMTTCVLAVFIALYPGLDREEEPAAQAEAQQEAPEGVVARVAGQDITMEELDVALAGRLHDLEQQAWRARRERLERLVEDRVLTLEAKARGMDVPGLVRAEVLSKQQPVSNATVEAYIQDNRAAIKGFKGSEEELRERVREFLTGQRDTRLVTALAQGLYPKYQVSVTLPEPRPRLVSVDPAGSPVLGPANATVLVAEFSDYECPACRKGHETVRQVRAQYADPSTGRVRWVFKDFPLDMHKDARKAAEAARCAVAQGKFWEMQDALYAAPDLAVDKLPELAARTGLDPEAMARCLAGNEQAPAVNRDLDQARRLGLEATPTFVIGGRIVTGTPNPERFKELLDTALAEAARERGPAAP